MLLFERMIVELRANGVDEVLENNVFKVAQRTTVCKLYSGITTRLEKVNKRLRVEEKKNI
jgi:hypothetical protein